MLPVFTYCVYFADISRVFSIFKVFGGKFIFYSSKILEYVIMFMMFVKLITFYVTIPFLSDFINNIIVHLELTYYFILIVNFLSFIIFSVIFCFSNMKDYFEKKKVFQLQILIFFIPLNVCIYVNLYYWVNTRYYVSRLSTIIFFSKDKTDIILTRFRMWYLTFWPLIMNFVALLILYLLSFSSSTDTNNQTDDILEKSLSMDVQI